MLILLLLLHQVYLHTTHCR